MTKRHGAAALAIVVVALTAVAVSTFVRAPPVTPGPPIPGLYGSGIAMDAKNNYQVGWTVDQKVSHRFRATTTSELLSVAIIQRGGPRYSGGDGGMMRVAVEADLFGQPSGTPLASLEFAPGNPTDHWERSDTLTFPDPAVLTAGTIYHIVFTNIAATSNVDFISVNEAYQFVATIPRQQALSDVDAVMIDRGEGWVVAQNDTPVMDLTYANGSHGGQAYIGVIADHYARITGPSEMAAERFTVSGRSRIVSSVAVRLKRIGGADPLSIRLTGPDRVEIAGGMVSAGVIPMSGMPQVDPVDSNRFIEASLAGGIWVTVSFDQPITLASGATYDLRLSTGTDTIYLVVPIREHSTESSPTWGSLAFRDGTAQMTTDGRDWRPIYEFAPVDLQFYFK